MLSGTSLPYNELLHPDLAQDETLADGEPSCWGESGLPLLPPAWRYRIKDRNLSIPFRPLGGRRRLEHTTLSLHRMFSPADWSNAKWPTTALDAARTTFEEMLEQEGTYGAIDTPLLAGCLVAPESITSIPLLTETWDVLEEAFSSTHDLAEFIATGTALELLQLTDCPQATVDVAITVPAWCRSTDGGLFKVTEPTRPENVAQAFKLAGERHVRTLCLTPRQVNPSSGWPSAIAGRAGATLDGVLTLEEAGDLIGVTRERVRQVCATLPLDHEHRRRWPLSLGFHRIAEVLETSTERTVSDVDNELRSIDLEGSSSLDFGRARSLLAWYGRSIDLTVHPTGQVLPSTETLGLPPDLSLDKIRNMVWELSERTGFLREDDLRRELDEIAPGLDPGVKTRAVDLAIGTDRLPLGYVFVVRHKKPAVVGALRRTLSWANPLPLEELHESFVRRFRFRSFPVPPPPEVLGALIERIDGFELKDGVVHATPPDRPDTTTIIGWIGEQLVAAEDQVLHRSVLYQEARQLGMNTISIGLYLKFGENIRATGRGCFRLVGSRPDHEAIERARSQALRLRVADKRNTTYIDSGIRLDVTVGNTFLDTGVISVPARAKRLIANRTLSLSSHLGSHGNTRLSGTLLYGFTSALMALDVMPGDQISIDLDLLTNAAILKVDLEPDE